MLTRQSCDQRRLDFLRPPGLQAEARELVDVASRAIADGDHRLDEVGWRNGDDAFAGPRERPKGMIALTHHAGDQRRIEFDHHVPGHRHNIGAPRIRRRQQNDGTGFKLLVDLAEIEIAHEGSLAPGGAARNGLRQCPSEICRVAPAAP